MSKRTKIAKTGKRVRKIRQKLKGRSLNPPQTLVWWNALKYKHWVFNKDRRLDGLPQLSLEEFAMTLGYDLSGLNADDSLTPAINVNKLP